MHSFSIEVTPPTAAKVNSFQKHMATGTAVNVTFLPGSDIEDTIQVCERLADDGMIPVPHVAARSLRDEAHLEEYISSLVSRAKVEEVLVVGGGVTNPVGTLHDTMQVLRSGILQRHGVKRVGLAAHPEGSPDMSPDQLRMALAEKNAWAVENQDKVQVYLETQWCMEAQAVIQWEAQIRSEGNALPIHIGLPGPCGLTQLIKFAHMSGIGASMRVLTRQAGSLMALASSTAPDTIITELAMHMAAEPECLIQKMHFYSFGGFVKTAKWATAVEQGNFKLNTAGSGPPGFSLT